MSESELIEALAEALQRALAPHIPWSAANKLARANRYTAASACTAYLRAHADEVCRLLAGVGPEAAGFAREWLANADDEGWPGQDDLRAALKKE